MLNRKRKLRFESLEGRVLAANFSMTELSHQSSGLNTPIEMMDVEGLRAAEIKIDYDPAVFATDNRSINAGSVWKGRGMVVANVDEVAGTITAFVFTSEPVERPSGNLVEIEFRKISNATHEETLESQRSTIGIQKVSLNEQEVVLQGDTPSGDEKYSRPSVRVAGIDFVDNNSNEEWNGQYNTDAQALVVDQAHTSDQTCSPETHARQRYILRAPNPSIDIYGPQRP
jgi:hypothetical protein